MGSKVLTVTLNPAIDRIVRIEKMLVGRDHCSTAAMALAGGKGVNAARALCALEVPVQATGLCGGVAGDLLTALLTQEGLPHAFVRIAGATRINTTIMDRAGAVTRVIETGPRVTAGEQRTFMVQLLQQAKACEAVLFCGRLPPGISGAALVRMIAAVKQKVSLVAVDTSGLALKAVLKAGVDIIKPNRAEAEEVLGWHLTSESRVARALDAFLNHGIKNVLISLGQDGLAASNGQEMLWVRVPPVKGGHAVGCGDAALAGFVAGHLAGKPFAACVDQAAACGTANMFAVIPGGISRNIIRKLGLKKY